ncbi:MAG: CotH kinase family protein [Cyclobacteriaceae bacterium]
MKIYVHHYNLSIMYVSFVKRSALLLLLYGCVSCRSDLIELATPDWAEASHSNNVEPDYDIVFNQKAVNTLEITMTADDWEFIQADMEEKFGAAFGAGGGARGGGFGGGNPPVGGGFPGGGGGALIFGTDDPEYVAASLKFNDTEWYKVGFRLKGNSTLSSSWSAGTYKLPFRLNFDKFEDDYPEITNQRFYGFEELSMSPAANDNSLIREKVAADIFRMAGIPAAQTAFYKVYINYGDGLKYCGVYTMVEVIDDSMVASQFGAKEGNIYKPESTFQQFAEEDFEKKNNETENDYSDVQAAIDALHAAERTTNPAEWRAELEEYFNAEHFIKWLAVNTVMVNWDTYGSMAHNYYLYNDPGQGLTWIPWDLNEAMTSRAGGGFDGGQGGGPGGDFGDGPGGGLGGSGSISLSDVADNWPLIRYLMDDSVYHAQYQTHVREFVSEVFTSGQMSALFNQNYNLIAPYVIGPEETEQEGYTQLAGTAMFNSALNELEQHVSTQIQLANEYLLSND